MSLSSIKGLRLRQSVLWIEDGEFRKELIMDSKNQKEEWKKVPLSDCKKIEHFGRVMGKLGPPVIFVDSVSVDIELDFDEVSLRMGKLEKR